MAEIKLVARTLDVFELYSREERPLSLTELANGLDAPMSSTLALVRTLIARGYLYETRRRAGYYPTRRLLTISRRIDAADSIENLAQPFLLQLREQTQETVVLGKCEGNQVIYLDVAQSAQAIRYTSEVGALRPLHANSLGKALLSIMPPAALDDALDAMDWKVMTGKTLTSRQALLQDLGQIRRRGWSENIGESVPDLAAIAMPFQVGGTGYAVSVAGPVARMQAQWSAHIAALERIMADLRQVMRHAEA